MVLQAVALADKDGSFCRMLGVEIADAKEGEPKTQRCEPRQPLGSDCPDINHIFSAHHVPKAQKKCVPF